MMQRRRRWLSEATLGRLLLCLLFSACTAQGDAGKHVPDVTKATLNSTLVAMPAEQHVLMEFYATWCPACRAFKPEYDKVAKFFASQPAGASKVVALRLDCAVDPDVCGSYQVASYPTMFAGSAADLSAIRVDKLTKFDYGKYSRNAKGVVKFVAEAFQLGDVTYVDAPEEQKPLDTTTPGQGVTKIAEDIQWTNPDVQLATVQLFESIAVQDILHSKEEQRTALSEMLQVWAATHPVPACRTGATDALKLLPEKWPKGKAATSADLKSLKVCGECNSHSSCTGVVPTPEEAVAVLAGQSQSKAAAPAAEMTWVACKGSKPEQRGYTCALWLLFHTTAARLQDSQAMLFMSHMKGFAHQFFQCEVCKRHYERLVDSAEAAAINNRRDAVLWVWKAHNEVNSRLAFIEKKYGHSSTGDAAFPKVQWPTVSACPQCRLPTLEIKSDERGGSDGGRRTGEALGSEQEEVKWNEEEVYRFLVKWYGGEPGSGTPEELAAGTAAAAIDEDESLIIDGDNSTSSIGLFGNTFNFAAVLVIAAVAYWLYSRSQKHRRPVPHVKGPGSLHHRLHGVQIPKHGRSSSDYSNGEASWWRHGQKREVH